jgi:membrane protease YdiL (CAAX protease family)
MKPRPEIIENNLSEQNDEWKFKFMLITAWITTLIASNLPNIILTEIFGGTLTSWAFLIKVGYLIIIIIRSSYYPELHPLRSYFKILLILVIADWFFLGLNPNLLVWKNYFGGVSFLMPQLGTQLLKIGVTMTMIIALFVMKKKRQDFFLVIGDLKAPANKVGRIIDEGTPWNKLALIISIIIASGVILFLLIFNFTPIDNFINILGLSPFIIGFAALNALNEEVSYRCSILSTSKDVMPKSHVLLLSALYFGFAHYYGVPYGIIGVLMSTLFGWFLSKSILETKGLFWAWFIHFIQDIIIFTFFAMISVSI